MDFKDLLFQHYYDKSSEIPMIADVIRNAAEDFARAIGPVQIAVRALASVASAGLDPMMFTALLPATPEGFLFFKGADEDWEYMIAGLWPPEEAADQPLPSSDPSTVDVTYHYVPGKEYELLAAKGPVIDLMRRKPGADHWQIYADQQWLDNGPPVGFLEGLAQRPSPR